MYVMYVCEISPAAYNESEHTIITLLTRDNLEPNIKPKSITISGVERNVTFIILHFTV